MDATTGIEIAEVVVEATTEAIPTVAAGTVTIIKNMPMTVQVAAVIGVVAVASAAGYGIYRGGKKAAAWYMNRKAMKTAATATAAA